MIVWNDGYIRVDPPKKPKKITGTRFGAIIGKNPWKTPFEIWCECTKTYEEPFEDTIYTIAGKTIEPKQAQYMHDAYCMDITTPTDVYGKDYFKVTRGDFFPENKAFGGMWDYLDRETETVLEMKTTKRAEDWNGEVPEYYALQVALYGYLLGYDNCCLVCSFLDDADYTNPENFTPSAENTIVYPFRISERYPDFAELVDEVEVLYNESVLSGISFNWDDKKDAHILKALRSTTVDADADLSVIISQAEGLKAEIEEVYKSVAEKEKLYKKLSSRIKEMLTESLTDDMDRVMINGSSVSWELSRTTKTEVDADKLKADGIYGSYTKEKTTLTLRTKEIKQ